MNLKEYRTSLNITIAEASQISGVPFRTYLRYEKDDKYGSSLKREMIINKLKVQYEITETKGILTVEKIRNIVSEVFEPYGDAIDFCYLFGSYAKGYPSDESDVDLCISTSLVGLDFVDLIGKTYTALSKKIDLIRLSDLKDNLNLVSEILKDGIKIYNKHQK